MKTNTNYPEEFFEEGFDEESNNASVNKALFNLEVIERHLTLFRILVGLCILLFLVAWNRGIAMLYAMDALLIATLFIGWLYPKFNIRNIEVDFTLPEVANEGDAVPILIKTQKTGILSRYMIELWGDFPFAPRFDNSYFDNSYFDNSYTEDESHSGMSLIPSIAHEAQHTMNIPCELRGHYTVDTFTLKTGFPLGLNTEKRVVTNNKEGGSSSILIIPTPLAVKQFNLSRDPSQTAMDLDNTPKTGGQDDYIGVREYRHGDSMKYIHWPSSAKRSELVVREYQQNSSKHLTIILNLEKDVNVGYGANSTLEYAIKISASLIKYCLEQQCSFTVFGLAKEPLDINSHNASLSNNLLQNVLESLAWIKADGNTSYVNAIKQHIGESRRGGTLVLFDSQNEVSALLPELQAQHYHPVIYNFNETSFLNRNPLPSSPKKMESNFITAWSVSNGCKLEELFV